MHYKWVYIIFAMFAFCFTVNGTNALTVKDALVDSISTLDVVEENCHEVFGDPKVEGTFGNYLQQIFNVFKYLAPALVIVLSIVEFIKAAASDDKDALTKATKKSGIRIFLALLLYFIPGLIDFLFGLLGWYNTCGIG